MELNCNLQDSNNDIVDEPQDLFEEIQVLIKMYNKDQVNKIINELKIYLDCHTQDCDLLIQFYGISKHPENNEYFIVKQYSQNGSLYDYVLKNFNNLNWEIKLHMLLYLSKDLKALHDSGYVHNNFYPTNILVFDNNLCAISTFSKCRKDLPLSNTDDNYKKANDIYEFGMIMYIVGTGYIPYDLTCAQSFDSNTFLTLYRLAPKFSKNIPKSFKELMERCWNPVQELCPDINEIYNNLLHWWSFIYHKCLNSVCIEFLTINNRNYSKPKPPLKPHKTKLKEIVLPNKKNLEPSELIDFIINNHFIKFININELTTMISIGDDESTKEYLLVIQYADGGDLRKYLKCYEISTIKNEILNLFINENTKFTHLYIPYQFDYQINLIPGSEKCFSELKYLSCNVNISDNVLTGLVEICKSIKELELFIEIQNNNYGIVKLIETPKKLIDVRLLFGACSEKHSPLYEILEKSLIKHANHIQHFKITKQPSTTILSSFVNLKSLELFDDISWEYLDDLSFPLLQNLKARSVPIKFLTNIIGNTIGNLSEIKIDHISHNEIGNKMIIQAIYKNCPNLKYLKLLFKNSNILELEKLLIKCQYLCGLFIIFEDVWDANVTVDYDHVFEILAKSSPINRHPILLQTVQYRRYGNSHFDLIESYKAKGIVEKYENVLSEDIFEVFKWV
ncbi:245_t:CDS:2 [Rhizophagus irregularis]|nr:245_t:CDS:2 [Rhizophagus irregularis]